MKRALTFAGFLRVAPCPEDAHVLTGERAAWEAGASAPVRLSFGGGKPAETSNGSQNGSQNGGGGVATSNGGGAKKTWKLALDDDEDGDAGGDDLVDEDALLESSAPVKRATEVVREWLHGGGAAGGRRACFRSPAASVFVLRCLFVPKVLVQCGKERFRFCFDGRPGLGAFACRMGASEQTARLVFFFPQKGFLCALGRSHLSSVVGNRTFAIYYMGQSINSLPPLR